MTDKNLSAQEAAMYLRLSPQTLANWRNKGDGPTFHKAGDKRFSRVLYRQSDLDAWLEKRRFKNSQQSV